MCPLHEVEESTFRELLLAAPDGILVCNQGGDIILANPQCEQLFGYTPRELIGKKIEVLCPDYVSKSHAHLRDTYFANPHKRPMGVGLDLTAKRKDGSEVPVEISLSPFTTTEGPCAIAVVRDVTELRRLGRELKKYNQELKRSNEELERFAYVASHDLQEPLRMVAGYTQLLKRRYGDKLDQEANEYIAFAVDGVKCMHDLINDLLAYSRLSTRSKPFASVDMAAVIQQVLANLEVSIQEADARIETAAMPKVWGDFTQLVQLMQNLLSNALKFHRDDAPPVIEVSADEVKEGWRFTVKDDGIGIESAYMEKIFVIFQRLHTREKYPGTGIGLAICKKIIERHGGRIWVESQPGAGTKFHFTLPSEPDCK